MQTTRKIFYDETMSYRDVSFGTNTIKSSYNAKFYVFFYLIKNIYEGYSDICDHLFIFNRFLTE